MNNNNNVLGFIRDRWSPLSFSGRPVEEEKLKAILEAARYAPSSMNEQPWLFIVVSREDEERFNDLLDILEETNRLWARSAYALIVSLARKNFTYKNRLNKYAVHDTGMAVGNMLIQAASMDLFVHQMGGYDEGRLRSYFDLGEEIEALAVMAIGYLGDGSELSGDLLRRHNVRKTRKNLQEYAFRNKLNNPAFGD